MPRTRVIPGFPINSVSLTNPRYTDRAVGVRVFVKMLLKPMSLSSPTLTRGGLTSMHCVSEKGSAPHGRECADYLRPIQIPRPTRMWVWVTLLALGLFADARVAHAAISYVQSNSVSPNNSSLSTLSSTFTSAQTAGNFNVVAVGFGSNTAVGISSVTDSKGNTYTLAVGPTFTNWGGAATGGTTAIYYAKNIVAAAAGANTVTVTFAGAVGFPDIRMAEYSGIDTTSPLDVTAASTGTGTLSNSGSVSTSNANDLLVGSNWVLSGTTGPGTGYTQRQISGWDGDILEDQIVSTVGAYSATAPISPSASWIMQLAAFKGAGTGGDTTPPGAPSALETTSVTSSQVNLSWTAATDNVGVTGYVVERCSGANCTNFLQIGTSTSTAYGDVGLTASSTYLYRVRATDAAGNLSGYSNTLTTTTSVGGGSGGDTQPPTAPTLSILAASSAEIDLTWNGSTDNVGVTAYLIERCQGQGCTNFAQVATSGGPTFSDTGLQANTYYGYRVRAQDGANNMSGYSNAVRALTTVDSGTCSP
jgi:chitodextrinase